VRRGVFAAHHFLAVKALNLATSALYMVIYAARQVAPDVVLTSVNMADCIFLDNLGQT